MSSESEQPLPSYIYLDENNQVKKITLTKLDSAAALVSEPTDTSQNKVKKKKQNPARLIRDSIFGKY